MQLMLQLPVVLPSILPVVAISLLSNSSLVPVAVAIISYPKTMAVRSPSSRANTLPTSPADFIESAGYAFTYGEAVELSGVPGLAAGTYIKMPARYAMLPGAWLLKPASNSSALIPLGSAPLDDGSYLVSGRELATGSGARSLWQRYVIETGENALQRSEYVLATSDSFFGESGLSDRDAGSLSLLAGERLDLAGTINATVAEGGIAARLDIAADDIAVVRERDGGISGVQLLDSQLSALEVGSLLIGGRREVTGDEVTITSATDRLTIASGAELELGEILLVANDEIRIETGATVSGQGQLRGSDNPACCCW